MRPLLDAESPEAADAQTVFDRIKARVLLPSGLAGVVAAFAIVSAVWPGSLTHPDQRNPWPLAMMIFLQSVLVLAVTVWTARRAGLHFGDLFSHVAPGKRLLPLVPVALPMLGLALAALYAFWTPLSFVFPTLTEIVLLGDEPVLYAAGPPYPIVGNLLGLLAMTVVGPISEEWFFRGLLLQRWSRKWGPVSGVVGSSLLFAFQHVDVLGAFLFGVVMSSLYARYHSLWAPTLVHGASNLVVWGIAVLDAHGLIGAAPASLSEFREAWWMPVAGSLLMLPWAIRVRRHWMPISTWKLGYPMGPRNTGVDL